MPDIPPDLVARTGDDAVPRFPGLNALSAQIAIVDARGEILWVNQAWRDFVAAYQPPGLNACEGANYYDVCTRETAAEATEMAAGLRAVITNERALFTQEYRSRTSDGDQWFSTRVTRLRVDGLPQVIIVHENITERKRAEAQTTELPREHTARADAETLQQRFAFLAEASALLASSLDYAATLGHIPGLVVPQLADWCSVYLVNEQDQLAPVAYLHRDPEKTTALGPLVHDYPPNVLWEGHPIAVALRTRQPQLIAQMADGWPEAAATDERHLHLLRLLGTTSLMALPLQARGQLLGVLILARTQPGRHFSATDLAFAEQVAARAALAIDNARLHRGVQQARDAAEAAQQQAERRTRRMQALAEAGQSFAEVLDDPSTALEHITRYIAEVQGDLCVIRLLSDDGDGLTSVALHHPDPETLRLLRGLTPPRLPMQGNQLYGPVIASGVSRLLLRSSLEEMHAVSTQAYWPFYDRYGVHNVLIVPLRARGRVTGTMALFRPVGKPPFTADEQSFLEALADRAALTVENVRLYREAQTQHRHLQAVLDQIPEAVVLGSAGDGQAFEQNAAAVKFCARFGVRSDWQGWSELQYFGQDGQLVPFNDLPLMRAARGETVAGVELRVSGPAGDPAVILISAAPVYDDDGQIASAVLVFQDITERKTLEQMQSDFMSLVAHELRTPLTVLIGQSQLMERRLRRLLPHREAMEELTGVDADRMAQSLRDILGGAQDMARLVNELLDRSRIETGRLELEPQPADLADLLRKVIARHQQLHPDRVLGMEGDDTPLWGMWDAGRLEQVFTNLLENAVKYSPGDRPVAVRVAAEAGSVQVTVQDWGIGIPAGDLPHIFDRHYRASNVGKASTGLGLGLYLTRQLAERHGGTVRAESTEGAGSTFTVTLPLEATAP